MGGEPLFGGKQLHIRGEIRQAALVEVQHTVGPEEIVAGQAAGESGGAAGRQYV